MFLSKTIFKHSRVRVSIAFILDRDGFTFCEFSIRKDDEYSGTYDPWYWLIRITLLGIHLLISIEMENRWEKIRRNGGPQ